MTDPAATAADALGRRLYAAGCRYAFGIPGGEVLALMRGLAGAGLRFVLARHENAAGFMAEGTWHATGAPGVLLATIGPGVANAVNVVANARQDRVPLLFFTGCVDASEAHSYTHQVFDHRELLRPLVKASFTLDTAALDVIADKALAIATDDPPGPVHVDVPIGVAGASAPARHFRPRPRPAPVAPAPGTALEQARGWLGAARRPLLIAGMEVLAHGAAGTLAAFARALGIPVLTTYKAKGVLAEDEPLALGAAGLSPKADALVEPLLARSDLVVLAGYDPIEMRAGWVNPFPESVPVVELASMPNTHYVHRASLAFTCDIGAGLQALRAGLTPRATWPQGEPARTRAALREAFAADPGFGPAAVVHAARRVLPRDGVATVDAGAHRILLSQAWTCHAPRTLLQSTGLCTMGCALPLATGYKLACPKTPVVAFVGDGGLEMVLGELATLRDLRLPVVVVVFVDESLALIELKQRRTQQPTLGVELGATDFPAVAAALGGHGAWAHSVPELEAGIAAGLAAHTFTVLACPIGPRAYDGRF